MSTKPPISSPQNATNNMPKYFSIKSRIGVPNFHNNAATMKNRSPRAATEATKNTARFRDVTPDRMVMTF